MRYRANGRQSASPNIDKISVETSSESVPISLILAPSGVGMNCAMRKFQAWLASTHGKQFLCRDIEEELLKLYMEEENKVTSPDCERLTLQMKTVIQDRSRAQIREMWRKAFTNAVKKLRADISSTKQERSQLLAVISGHSVYYHPSLPQFYCPLDPPHIQKELQSVEVEEKRRSIRLTVQCVILLIDDIYDMYEVLSQKDAVLSRKVVHIKAISRLRESLGNFESVKEPDVETDGFMEGITDDEKIACLEADLNQLVQVLDWRIQEMTIVEHLAVELGARFALFATKQCMESLRRILSGSPIVYVSHPITKPRNSTSDGGGQLGENELAVGAKLLVQSLARYASISPTGIDELRFQKVPVVEGRVPFRRTTHLLRDGSLSERWPLLDEIGELLYPSRLDEKTWADVAKRMFLAECSSFKNRIRVDSAVKQLENWIGLQVGIRDHQIVAHSGAVLVFRQYYGGEESAGVKSEMKHWGYIVDGKGARKALYVLYPDDVLNMTMFIGEMGVVDGVAEALIELLSASVPHLKASMLREIRTHLGDEDSVLGQLVDPGNWNRIHEALRGCRIEDLTRKALPRACRALLVPPSASFVLVDDNDDLLRKTGNIESLLSESPQSQKDAVLEDLTSFWASASDEAINEVLRRRLRGGEGRPQLQSLVELELEQWKRPFLIDRRK